jgi:pimeloyl-ACP methyl ester carboxylesterase
MAERARLMSTVDFAAHCQQVKAPTLVVTGEPGLDRVVSVRSTRSYVDRIAGARHATLERTGHIGLVTRPERFAETIGQFVVRTAARPEAARRCEPD